MTPLHLAAKSARFRVVKYLVDKGDDINTKDSNRVSTIFMCLIILLNETFFAD